jgi:hypothetical protein
MSFPKNVGTMCEERSRLLITVGIASGKPPSQ